MKFGEHSSKFDGLGLNPIDTQLEIANKFASLVFDKPGWYRGTIDYELDENGKVSRIDELKVTMTAEQTPSRSFKELEGKPETRWVPGAERGTQKMQHKTDGEWKDVPPFFVE